MNTDVNTKKILDKLEEKISLLGSEKELKEKQINEIDRLQDMIRVLKDDPLSFYSLSEEQVGYISEFIDIDVSQLRKYSKIYECYLLYGEDAVEQISDVKLFVNAVKDRLDDRNCKLADEIAERSLTIIKYESYSELFNQLNDDNCYVTRIELLIDFLADSDLTDEEKRLIKLDVLDRNVRLYNELVETKDLGPVYDNNDDLDDEVIEDTVDNEYDIQKNIILEKIQSEFSPKTCKYLKAVAESIEKTDSREEVLNLLEEWEPVFGNNSSENIVSGIIGYLKIGALEIRSIIEEDAVFSMEYTPELDKINEKICMLEEYKIGLGSIKEEQEKETELKVISSSKFDCMVANYNPDPLASPNCVLFLNDAVESDITSIKDPEAIKDVFVLIENLKNGVSGYNHRYTYNDVLRDIQILKPHSKGHQARIAYKHLKDNTVGILWIGAKKADNPKDILKTVGLRQRNSNMDIDGISLDVHLDRTGRISSTLYELVKPFATVKSSAGGVK